MIGRFGKFRREVAVHRIIVHPAVTFAIDDELPFQRRSCISDGFNSFANAVIPMLARHFDITVRDPRYDTTPVSGEYDAALVVCGIDTLATTPFTFDIVE